MRHSTFVVDGKSSAPASSADSEAALEREYHEWIWAAVDQATSPRHFKRRVRQLAEAHLAQLAVSKRLQDPTSGTWGGWVVTRNSHAAGKRARVPAEVHWQVGLARAVEELASSSCRSPSGANFTELMAALRNARERNVRLGRRSETRVADLTEVPPPSGGPNELGTGSAIGNLDEPLAAQVHFRGEESARFVAFAHLCIAANIGAEVRLEGFEPASNRRVALRGTVQDAHQEGYVRTLTVRSDDALLYSIGGNNATLEDIACEQITFIMGLDQFVRLQERADSGQHVPGVKSNTVAGKRWLDLEDLLSGARSVEDIRALVRLIGNSDGEMSRGASRSLRSFHRELIRDRALSLEIEAEAIECLRSSEDLDTRVALLESIGYFGSHAGRQVCADIVSDRSRHAHERWAAVVSLSRLGAGNKIAVLDAACGDEDLQVRTAAALGRAQQLEPIGRRTERVLVKSLLKEDDEVPRHVCAALARLHSPRGATLKGLVAVAISDHSTLIQAGSVASCLVGWLPRVSAGGRRRLRLRLEAFINSVRTPCESPSEIWALEYLAELSSALGAFDLSRKYFELCSQSCSDWKASYYAALACYESGEEYRVKGRRSLSLEEFTRSAKLLSSLQGGDPLTVAFRADVVAARIRIARASMLIPADADTSQIERAIDELLAARSLYARYMRRDEPAININVILIPKFRNR